MPIARADEEAKPRIKISGSVKIAHGMNDVIETAGHSARNMRRSRFSVNRQQEGRRQIAFAS
jgi:hypothetical protein